MSFYGPWKSYDEEIQDFTGKLDGLQNILKILEGFILDEDELSVVASDQYKKLVLSNLASCQTACRRLEEMLEKCKSTDCSPLVRKHDWLRLKRAAYPFKKETLVTLSQTVSGLQDNLSLALQLLNSALINQQQKQLRDIISRTVSIDSRTTTILDVVKQDKTTSDLSPSGLRQQMIVRRQSYKHPVLDPSVLHSFCNRQELINNSWRRRQQQHGLRGSDIDTISRYCACSCRPFASSSFSISVFALHEAHCPLYEAGRHTVGVAANYTLCNRLLGLSMSVMMTLTRGAGACSVSPVIQFHGLVRRSSPAFELVYHVMKGIKQGRAFEALEATRTGLLMLFREKKAAPTDRLADGSTILHVSAPYPNSTVLSKVHRPKPAQQLLELVTRFTRAPILA
ncbi:hypothetical protein BJY00DRAFT_287749 [Aspergillus carlsbadensis]|nr:hypothetical protein BJY00DRAFT_287749 [Aspergillus carlsbadensis]